MNKIQVAIIDDHQLVIEGILLLLNGIDDIKVIGSAHSSSELSALMTTHALDVLLMDISLKGETGVELLPQIKKEFPSVQVIVLSMHNEPSLIKQMIKNGASGYVLKDADKDELVSAIRKVASGQTFYSPAVQETIMTSLAPNPRARKGYFPKVSRREKEILKHIVDEKTTAEIAALLFISPGTVETHRRNLLSKLGARNTAGLVRISIEHKLLED